MQSHHPPHTHSGTPSRWPIGPPAPPALVLLARALMLVVLLLVSLWISQHLGGVAFRPIPDAKGGNDTNLLFNWHPVLMTLAFAVFMAEACLAYKAPLVPWLNRLVPAGASVPGGFLGGLGWWCLLLLLCGLHGGLAATPCNLHNNSMPAGLPGMPPRDALDALAHLDGAFLGQRLDLHGSWVLATAICSSLAHMASISVMPPSPVVIPSVSLYGVRQLTTCTSCGYSVS